ncbi:MAG TPA: chromosome segregation protein SMC [Herpetosiphonaceae bacterium]
MYLKRLEIYGFKTFAQRTTFEFPPGVTAVVGPNGSGKSNVADAVRWVLGEQSFANLRSKRTEDLIFGGGKGRAPMGFAEVFLTIDNADRLLALPYDEVTIGRRAYRSGESEYTINRARVRLRDVLDAVAPLGSSYTLINQGLVDAALALQPEERRRLFEDAAEIGPYQAKKQEAERRLRETEANLVRLSDLVSELEPQLRTLKRQARDAEAVGAVEAELGALLRRHYAQQWTETTEQLAAAETDETRLAAELAEKRAAREAVVQTLQADREQMRQRRATLDQLRSALARATQQAEASARELAVAQERSTGLRQRQAELAQRRSQLETAAQAAREQVEQLAAQAAQREAALSTERARLHEAETALRRELDARRAAEAELAAQREALVRATTALETERVRQQSLARRLTTIIAEQAELAATIQQSAALCEQRDAEVTSAQQAVAEAEQHIAAVSKDLDTLRADGEALRRERDQLDERITGARRAHGELQARYDALNRLARSYEGTFAGVRAAMQWAERENRSRFALVSSLLRVPAELETAIEVALGARLQHIVVERWSDAEAAIAQLKRTNTGRATFLPLDTLKPARRLAVPPLPGIRGVAADLIAVDGQYAPIAVYLLGRTLIAEDLAAARRALPELEGGWTIVTLSGEQVATGGAVTGGAATRESGTLRRERELRELPAQLSTAQQLIERLQTERGATTQRIDVVQLELRQAEMVQREARTARDQAQRSVEERRRVHHRAEADLAALQRRRDDLRREQSTLEQQTRAGQAVVETAEAAHRRAQAQTSAAEAGLTERLAAMGNDEAALRELRARVAQQEAEHRSQIAAVRAQEQAAERATGEQAMVAQQAQHLAHELEALTQTIEILQARQSEQQAQAQAVSEQVTTAQATLREAEQRLEALEARERELTGATLTLEATHGAAAVELQRRRSDRDALWERAAEDSIDVEQLVAERAASETAEADESSEAATLAQRIEQLRTRLRRMGPVNALAPEEYRATQERYGFLNEQLADVRAATVALREAIGHLDQVMQEHFAATFEAVGQEFSRMFTRLFGGGSARLVLLHDESDAGVYGIEIMAQPPGKRQLNLQLLSGGERALTAAALLFAILTVNPSPFCILDEVDAALDEANVVRFREALLQLAQQTQFILVTHNRGTVEAADTLYGITMSEDGGSRVLSLRLEEVEDDGSLSLAG